MNRFAKLLAAASCLAVLGAAGVEPTTALPHASAAWASAENDLGQTDPGLRLTNLTLVLNRPAERQRAFESLLKEQQDPKSPNFHRWLTPAEIGEQFGPADEDIAAVSSWLRSQGLQVDSVASSRVRIEFSGLARNVGAAFGTPLHTYLVDSERMIAPDGAPRIPTSLAPILKSVHGLQSVRERPQHHSTTTKVLVAAGDQSKATLCSSGVCNHYIGPGDFAAIYNVNPVYQQGINGSGQTIAIVGRARVYLPDIANFQRLTALAAKDPVIIVPPNGVDPGLPASTNDGTKYPDQGEATLDVTRAGSVAPGATIQLVVSANPPNSSGVAIATQYVVSANLAQIMSISFGSCEQLGGQGAVSFWDSVFSQAAAQGISVFVSSGDAGAAGCDKAFTTPPATQFASPNSICSSSYVTCVGGTEFADTANPSAYWSVTNSAGRVSALGYIPEGAWNEPLNSSGNLQVAASGGGMSAFIPKPFWQAGPGVPVVQGRCTPDVSFSAARHVGYLNCFAAAGTCLPDSNGAFSWSVSSGTSASAPSMAGVAALLNQKIGAAQGNLNPHLYALAATPGNTVFHDITVTSSGVVNCDPAVPSMCNNSTASPTGLTGGLSGYVVGPGYDMVTGLGSIDVANLLTSWSSVTLPAGQLQLPASITFGNQLVGTQSAHTVVSIANIGGTDVTISSVTGTDLAQFPGGTNCVTTLQPGGGCTLALSFAPSSAGLQSETITFTSTGVGSPQSFTASGIGITGSESANTPGPLSGLWWNPSESGWGIDFTQRRNVIFAAWYTYDANGNPKWYVASSCTMPAAGLTSGTCNGTLYEVNGPTFFGTPFNPGAVNLITAGTLSVTFANASNGSMTYTVGAQARTVSITRQVFAAGSVPGIDYTDLWWNPNESGWGMSITQQASVMFLAWYVYDSSGRPVWYVASNCAVLANGCTGTLYRTTGPALGPTFDSTRVQLFTVGTVTLTFTDPNNGTLSYSVNGVAGTKNITRQIF